MSDKEFPENFESMTEAGIPSTPSADLDARAEMLEAAGTNPDFKIKQDPYLEGIMAPLTYNSKNDQVGKVLANDKDDAMTAAAMAVRQPTVVVISHINSHGKLERQHVLGNMDKVGDFMRIAYKDFCRGADGIWICCYDHVIVQEHIIK